MKPAALAVIALSASLAIGLFAACSTPEARTSPAWRPAAAAEYLDRRADWWMGWPGAARDHETFCISCHTTLPYAISRAALHSYRDASSDLERRLLDNVTKRVRLWHEIEPYYRDKARKAEESRGTEAVVNALVLASRDARTGRLSDDARTAFGNMWALQQTT